MLKYSVSPAQRLRRQRCGGTQLSPHHLQTCLVPSLPPQHSAGNLTVVVMETTTAASRTHGPPPARSGTTMAGWSCALCLAPAPWLPRRSMRGRPEPRGTVRVAASAWVLAIAAPDNARGHNGASARRLARQSNGYHGARNPLSIRAWGRASWVMLHRLESAQRRRIAADP